MKNKTDQLTSKEWKALQKPSSKPPPEKKIQSGKENLDLSSSEISKLIDGIILRAPEYIEYDMEQLEVMYKGLRIKISFKVMKK